MTQAQRRMRTGAARARATATKEHEATRATSVRANHAGEAEPYYNTDEREPLTCGTFGPGEEPAFVRVAAGLTINLGDFNSLRLDCSVTLPCKSNERAINKAYEEAAEFVSEKLDEEQTKWLPNGQGRGRGR